MTRQLGKKLPSEEVPNHENISLELHLQVKDLAKTLMSTSKKPFNKYNNNLK